jgi:hypothetical protein
VTESSPAMGEAKPDVDTIDQQLPVFDDEEFDLPVSIPADVPEADALEQAMPLPLVDDEPF